MPDLTKTLFLNALDQWGLYAEAFERLPADKQAVFLAEQGFASLHDLLAHVAAWWEEAAGIIHDTLWHRDRPPRKYDLDAFNAAALARFKDTPEADLLEWYEARRQQMIELVSSLSPAQMSIGRVSGWLDAVLLEHLKEHALEAPRFLVIDTLQREWADGGRRFGALSLEEQAAFLKKQGFARFRDLVAHVLAWWEEGIRAIEADSHADICADQDVDAFNATAIEQYGKMEESTVFADYENTRRTLINLADSLPDEVFLRTNVQDWFRSDVVRHYYEHAV